MKKLNILLATSCLALGFVGCGTANNLRDATDSYGYSYNYPSENQNRYGYDGYGLGNNNYYNYNYDSYDTYDSYGTGSYGYGYDLDSDYGRYGTYNSYGTDLGYTGSTRGGNAYWDGYGINTGKDIQDMFDSSFDSNSMLN